MDSAARVSATTTAGTSRPRRPNASDSGKPDSTSAASRATNGRNSARTPSCAALVRASLIGTPASDIVPKWRQSAARSLRRARAVRVGRASVALPASRASRSIASTVFPSDRSRRATSCGFCAITVPVTSRPSASRARKLNVARAAVSATTVVAARSPSPVECANSRGSTGSRAFDTCWARAWCIDIAVLHPHDAVARTTSSKVVTPSRTFAKPSARIVR